MPVNALLFGAGAVGSVYGFVLHSAGATVSAVCRTNYETVKERGIQIRSLIWGDQWYHPHVFKTASDAKSNGPFDYIVVASKAFPGTAELIKDIVTPGHTAIVLAQNGIGIEADCAQLYPTNTIVSGVVYLPVTQVRSGVVEMLALERFEIGTYPAQASAKAKAQTQQLADLWKKGGATAVYLDDVQPLRWFKCAVNASWNSITALTLCDDANYLRSSNNAEAMIKKVMREVGHVAAAAGYPDAVTEEKIEKDLERPRKRLTGGGKEPSMLTDVRANRPIEVEAILGNTLRIAQEHGVDTPCIELLYTLAKARAYAIEKPPSWKPISSMKEDQPLTIS